MILSIATSVLVAIKQTICDVSGLTYHSCSLALSKCLLNSIARLRFDLVSICSIVDSSISNSYTSCIKMISSFRQEWYEYSWFFLLLFLITLALTDHWTPKILTRDSNKKIRILSCCCSIFRSVPVILF
jgi:hypothetical protein